MIPKQPDESWRIKTVQPLLNLTGRPIRPADISDALASTMLARENLLEDVNYSKVVPNRFVVEINAENYRRNYQPIEAHVLQQWRDHMLQHLVTANSRLGRRMYRFGGSVVVEIRASEDIQPTQARLLYRIQQDGEAGGAPPAAQAAPPVQLPPQAGAARSGVATACLELMPGHGMPPGMRWSIGPGTVTLGRRTEAAIPLDFPEVQERRLVSGFHAYLQAQEGGYRLFDGTLEGRPSLNGTYVNNRRVPASGALLHDGDVIILASLDPDNPRPDTPGVVALRFRQEC